jgi:hypothetical protein
MDCIPLLRDLREISIRYIPPAPDPKPKEKDRSTDDADADLVRVALNVIVSPYERLQQDSGADPKLEEYPLLLDIPETDASNDQPADILDHEALVQREESEDAMNIQGILYCWTRANRNPALQSISLPGRGTTRWIRERGGACAKWTTKVV